VLGMANGHSNGRQRTHTTGDGEAVWLAGATGRLGLTADLPLARGYTLRAMTRDPFSPPRCGGGALRRIF
jgi:hypothetical protein